MKTAMSVCLQNISAFYKQHISLFYFFSDMHLPAYSDN